MRILLVNQYFWPDMAATAQLLADLAEDLARAGHTVTALAGRGRYAPGRQGALPAREEHAGVAIRRVWCTDFGRGSRLGRVLDYGTYLLSAWVAVRFGARHDVIVCLSTPPLVAVLGLVARVRGARFIYKVEDLYPDVAIALGTFRRGSLLDRFLANVSRRLLRRADAVVALDEAMAATLRERGARRVEVVPNWADGDAIRPDAGSRAHFRRDYAIEGRFVVLYSGNFGLAHRFDALTAAAYRLAVSDPEVLLVLVGGGPRFGEVRTSTDGLLTVRVFGYQPRERLGELYNAADVHVVTLRDEVAGLLVPSKYAAALAAGKPVLLVGGRGTDMWAEIERERLGWCCDHDAAAVARAIGNAREFGAESEAIGTRARAVFERRYARGRCTARWAQLLAEIGGV